MNRYLPARQHRLAGIVALALAGFSFLCGTQWRFAFIPAALFLGSAAALFYLATRPAIEVNRSGIKIGPRSFRWRDVERIEPTAWASPLVLRILLQDGRWIRVIYPGDTDAIESLLEQMKRLTRRASADELAGAHYADEVISLSSRSEQPPSRRFKLLRPEDAAEVERLYQRLKTAGHLDKSPHEDHQS